MTNEEVMSFIQKIKRDYSKFDLTSEEYQMWHDQLLKLDIKTAETIYENHKSSEYKNKVPSLQIFLYKPKEEKVIERHLLKCSKCGKILYYEAMRKHESRHLSLEYIKSRTKLFFNSEIAKEKEREMLDMNDIEFDKKYDEFLEKLVNVTHGLENRNLLIIKYVKDNPGKRIDLNYKELGSVANEFSREAK